MLFLAYFTITLLRIFILNIATYRTLFTWLLINIYDHIYDHPIQIFLMLLINISNTTPLFQKNRSKDNVFTSLPVDLYMNILV